MEMRTSPFAVFSGFSINWHLWCSQGEVVFVQHLPGLEQLAKVLDNVSWKYWKPGEQPAKILDWMQLRMQLMEPVGTPRLFL